MSLKNLPLWVSVASTVSMGIAAHADHFGIMMVCFLIAVVAGSLEFSNSMIRTSEVRISARPNTR